MNGEIVGYAVIARIPDLTRDEAFAYELASSVFHDPVRADNARTYCKQKLDPRAAYLLVEITEVRSK